MNRRKEPVSKRTQKKVVKEVKKGIRTASPERSPEELKIIAKMHPNKKKTVKKVSLGNVSKTVARKLTKPHQKLSKRVSPEEKIVGSSPAHVHKENDRWDKTIRKQSVLKGKRLSRKLSHQTKRARS